jgi:hypothetical protein
VVFGIGGFGGIGSAADSDAGVGTGFGDATVGAIGATSGFLGTLATAFFASGRVRVFAALLPAAFALRELAAFLAAALRFRVVAAFLPALLRLGLMSILPCGMD